MAKPPAQASTVNEDPLSPIITFTLTTSTYRVFVRPYQQSDITAVAREANNPRIVANMTDRFPHPYTLADAQDWVDRCLDSSTWKHSSIHGRKLMVNYVIAIGMSHGDQEKEGGMEEQGGVAVGGIGLEFQSDVYRRCAKIGYWLGEGHWGRGIMSAVVRAFVPWVWATFGEEELVRLSANVYAWNPASVKVLQSVGFEVEGRQRLAIWKNGRLGDAILLGLVRPGMVDGDRVMG